MRAVEGMSPTQFQRRTPQDGGDSRRIKMNNKSMETRVLTGVAIFTAIVIVLQLLGAFIRFGPFSISLVMIPIVVGAALYGPAAGAWLGLVFGIVVLISGDAGAFLTVNPLGTVATVVAKGTLAGWISGLVYKALSKHEIAAAITASVAAPVVNTGIFLIGCLVFFMPTITEWATAAGAKNVGTFMIVGIVGMNFLIELALNLVLSSTITQLIRMGKKSN